MLRAALEALGQDDTSTRARLLATLGLELVWGADLDQRKHYSDEALSIARRLGDAATLADVLICRFFTVAEPRTVSDRLADTTELLAVCERLADPVIRCRAYHLRSRVASEVADLEEADRCVAAYERLAQELGQPTINWIGLPCRTGLILVAGEIPEAERLAGQILEIGQQIGQSDAAAYWAAHLFDVRRDQGRLAGFETDLVTIVHDFPGLAVLRADLALLYCELDDNERARPIFEEFAADLNAVPLDMLWSGTVAALAEVCAHLGDTRRAAALFRMLAPYADQFVAVGGSLGGSLSHRVGMLATVLSRFDEAERFFAAAAATHERVKAPAWLARTRLEWARTLLAREQPDEVERAQDLLGEALATARKLGLATVERRAVALLGRTP